MRRSDREKRLRALEARHATPTEAYMVLSREAWEEIRQGQQPMPSAPFKVYIGVSPDDWDTPLERGNAHTN